MSDVFFTADEHFGHQNIMVFSKRPFTSLEEMREELIARHNAKVPKGSRVYHVGDMFWRTLTAEQCMEIVSRLNGVHYYVYGNHDEPFEKSPELRAMFLWCKERAVLNPIKLSHGILSPKIVLDHYAGRVWRGSHKGTWQLYGHSHAALPEINNRSFDIGVDSSPDYSPFSLEDVEARMKKKIEAGAHDPLKPQIDAEPWNKGEIPPPIVPNEVWAALEESQRSIEAATGCNLPLGGRCVQ